MSVTCSCHMLKHFNTINQTRDKQYRRTPTQAVIILSKISTNKTLQTARYLFLISKLVVYWRLLRRLDLDLLCGRPVRGVTVGQVAHARVGKL